MEKNKCTSEGKCIHEAKVSHIEKFFEDINCFSDSYFFNYSPSTKAFQRIIEELKSKIAIEDAIHLLNKN